MVEVNDCPVCEVVALVVQGSEFSAEFRRACLPETTFRETNYGCGGVAPLVHHSLNGGIEVEMEEPMFVGCTSNVCLIGLQV